MFDAANECNNLLQCRRHCAELNPCSFFRQLICIFIVVLHLSFCDIFILTHLLQRIDRSGPHFGTNLQALLITHLHHHVLRFPHSNTFPFDDKLCGYMIYIIRIICIFNTFFPRQLDVKLSCEIFSFSHSFVSLRCYCVLMRTKEENQQKQ